MWQSQKKFQNNILNNLRNYLVLTSSKSRTWLCGYVFHNHMRFVLVSDNGKL
jgi:hypothetical protein